MGEGGWPGVGKCGSESASGADGDIIRGAFRYSTIVWGKFNSVDDVFRSGLRDAYSVAHIVFGGTDNVPPGDAMGCPGAANSGGLKYEEFCARRSEGCTIEVKGSIDLGFS